MPTLELREANLRRALAVAGGLVGVSLAADLTRLIAVLIPRGYVPSESECVERGHEHIRVPAEERRGKIVELQQRTAGQGDRPFDDALELTDVAGPVVGQQRVGRGRRQRQRPERAMPIEKVPRELDDVVAGPLTPVAVRSSMPNSSASSSVSTMAAQLTATNGALRRRLRS